MSGGPPRALITAARELLAARFGDEVVVLDVAAARLAHLDARSACVWDACTGRTREQIAQVVGLTHRRTQRILRDLEAGGLIRCEAEQWHRIVAEEV